MMLLRLFNISKPKKKAGVASRNTIMKKQYALLRSALQ